MRAHYEERGALSVVDARRPIEQVTDEILDALGHPESARYYETSQRS